MWKSLGAVVVAVALVACGRGATVTVDTASPPSSVQDDRAAASRVLLAASDLPGFVAGPPATAPDPTTLNAASGFESCAGASTVLQDGERMVLSPGYFRGQTAAVSSLAMVAATQDQAQVGRCITGLFSSVLGFDQVPGTTAKTEAGPASKVGDQTVTWHTTIQVGGQGGTAYAHLTFVRTGRVIGSLLDFQLGSPFPTAERARLLDTLAARANAV